MDFLMVLSLGNTVSFKLTAHLNLDRSHWLVAPMLDNAALDLAYTVLAIWVVPQPTWHG
jgi:hypothetical protein